uniref:Methionyl-tRNA formyltransferase n=1 Tax=uncultured Chloroflexota bacterium TaxID=166587 RepID=H5SDX3_9CHLR|nr:methionyl-tRNA formyltransferase [uncultured Chloroflexota bacterium]
MTRLVFMGSPQFALPALRALAQHETVVGVVTQPDRPAGRGQQLTPPPVKILAQELGLEVIQPVRLRDAQTIARLQAWQPEVIVVAAYGQILPPQVLDLPPWGCLNIHASLLPRWRGAAPIQHAILAGDAETGVTIMKMDEGLDTGPILSQRAIPIAPDENAETLGEKLANLGASLLLETLPQYLSGRLHPRPQPVEGVTLAPRLKKEDGQLDFSLPAVLLERRVRAFFPWPGAWFSWQGMLIKVLRARVGPHVQALPGAPLRWQGWPALATAHGLLVLEEVQPAGKKPMSGKAFLAGARHWGA